MANRVRGRGPGADLPPLLVFNDGRAVDAPEAWNARRREVATLMRETFTGTFPAETPPVREESVAESMRDAAGNTRRRIMLCAGPAAVRYEIRLWLPPGAGPHPLLLTQPRYYQIYWAEDALARGYAVCLYPGLDSHHHEEAFPGYETVWESFRAAWPEAKWAEIPCKAWIASRTLDYLLAPESGHRIDTGRVGILGFSRYGKQSLIAAAFDPRFKAVLARSAGSPGSTPYRFSGRPTFMEAPRDFPDDWFPEELRGYTGREHELPFDAHGWLGLLAPRHCLLDTAYHDNGDPSFGVERAYREGKTVYRLLGVPARLCLDYRPGKHADGAEPELITPERRQRNLDWFDTVFGRKALDMEEFDHPPLHSFDWTWWKAQQPANTFDAPRGGSLAERVSWMLGEAPEVIPWSGARTFWSEETRDTMEQTRFSVPGVTRIGVSFGENVQGSLYVPANAAGPLTTVVWLQPWNYSTGHAEAYGVESCAVYYRLAQAGLAVLAYDQAGFGTRLFEGHQFYSVFPQWSRFGRMLHDLRAAVDYLRGGAGASEAAVPGLDPNRIFLLGYSLGGMLALYGTALDARVAGAASFCGFTPLRGDTGAAHTGGIRRLWDWHGLLPRLGLFDGREQEIPYDYADLLAAVKPRPCLVYAPRQDREADFEAVRECVAGVAGAWLTFEGPDDINRFQRAQQERFVNWLQSL